jgi:hypothetical protein
VTEGTSEQGQGVGGMSARAASWLAWSMCAVSLSILALSLLLILLGWSTPPPRGWTPWREQALSLVGIIGAPILGGFIASRRPHNSYGWLWLSLGLSFAFLLLAEPYAAYALVVEPESLPAPKTVAVVLGGLGWVAGIAILPLLLLLFPDGRPPSRRWRFLTWTVVATGTVLMIIGLLLPGRSGFVPGQNPLGAGGVIGEVVTILAEVGVWAIGAAIILSALSLVFRYRRATRIERQQIKWFLFAAGVLIGYFLLADYLPEPWNSLLSTVALTGLYVAVGVAILRYRLYNIDRIINRTLVYGPLTVSLAAVYFGGVATTQTLFRALAGQEQQPQLAIVVSTLVIAALFNPLRRRIQSFIDRRFYRRKYDAAKTLEAFSAKLRDETDLDALNAELVGVVRETMQPAHVSLWLRPDTDSKGQQVD